MRRFLKQVTLTVRSFRECEEDGNYLVITDDKGSEYLVSNESWEKPESDISIVVELDTRSLPTPLRLQRIQTIKPVNFRSATVSTREG